MARFLSVEWMDDLNRAAVRNPAPAGGTNLLALQQVVTHSDGTSTAYVVSLGGVDDADGVGGGSVRLRPGRVDQPDATLTTDYATAAAVSRGELSAHAALLAGRVRVSGDSGALVRGADALARAQTCWYWVRAHTEY